MDLLAEAAGLSANLTDLRRRLHRCPEVGLQLLEDLALGRTLQRTGQPERSPRPQQHLRRRAS